jgi:methylated-DNA-[protein]-cysteine S-methyltransferase
MVNVWLVWDAVAAPAPIGALTIGVTEAGIALVCFGDGPSVRRQLAEAAQRLDARPSRGGAEVGSAAAELVDYLGGRRRQFEQPIDWRLTHGDQRVVLTTLYDSVGYGETVTYGELALRSDAYGAERRGQAARRVGSIMGSNPIPIVVPCHRVLAADGLGGFGGGLATKRWLLELEGALPPALDLDWGWPAGAGG